MAGVRRVGAADSKVAVLRRRSTKRRVAARSLVAPTTDLAATAVGVALRRVRLKLEGDPGEHLPHGALQYRVAPPRESGPNWRQSWGLGASG